MYNDGPSITLTWKQAQSVDALIHDWTWMFMDGRTIMTVEDGQRLRHVADLIDEYRYDLENGEV